MKMRLGILLLFCLSCMMAQAWDGHGDKDKGKCKKPVKIHSVEEFVFMVPPSADNTQVCIDEQTLHQSVINFYKWYLQHENQIRMGLNRENKGKDLLPPFNISWVTLHEYFEVIQKNYGDWINEIHPEFSTDSSTLKPPSISEVTLPVTLDSSTLQPASISETTSAAVDSSALKTTSISNAIPAVATDSIASLNPGARSLGFANLAR